MIVILIKKPIGQIVPCLSTAKPFLKKIGHYQAPKKKKLSPKKVPPTVRSSGKDSSLLLQHSMLIQTSQTHLHPNNPSMPLLLEQTTISHIRTKITIGLNLKNKRDGTLSNLYPLMVGML